MSTTNRQVAHIWAQGNRAEARGSNFRCNDNVLYSYGTCIAFIQDGTAFVSSDNMTPTTGKQLSYARSALRNNYTYLSTPAFRYGSSAAPSPIDCIREAAQEHAETFKSVCRARSNMEWAIEHYTERRAVILDTAARFNVTDMPDMPEAAGDLKEKARQFAAQDKQRRADETRRREERERAERIIDAGRRDAWMQRGEGHFPNSYRVRGEDYITLKPTVARMAPNEPLIYKVVTSQGAEAPLEHVIKALRFYDSRVTEWSYPAVIEGDTEHHRPTAAACTPYATNGHRVPLGHFTLDSIDSQGNVKAGCHYFTAAEIARFRMQWAGMLADTTDQGDTQL